MSTTTLAKGPANAAAIHTQDAGEPPTPPPLPKLGADLAGGQFMGILSDSHGMPYALILLGARPGTLIDWSTAKAWAAGSGGDLPTRCEAAMLISSYKGTLCSALAWTNEEYRQDSPLAWGFVGNSGRTCTYPKETVSVAIAVRRVPLAICGAVPRQPR